MVKWSVACKYTGVNPIQYLINMAALYAYRYRSNGKKYLTSIILIGML